MNLNKIKSYVQKIIKKITSSRAYTYLHTIFIRVYYKHVKFYYAIVKSWFVRTFVKRQKTIYEAYLAGYSGGIGPRYFSKFQDAKNYVELYANTLVHNSFDFDPDVLSSFYAIVRACYVNAQRDSTIEYSKPLHTFRSEGT